MTKFDYGTPAELFMAKRRGGTRQPLGYRRFPSAAEAIRYAIEEFPAVKTLGAWMQVGDDRFDSDLLNSVSSCGCAHSVSRVPRTAMALIFFAPSTAPLPPRPAWRPSCDIVA